MNEKIHLENDKKEIINKFREIILSRPFFDIKHYNLLIKLGEFEEAENMLEYSKKEFCEQGRHETGSVFTIIYLFRTIIIDENKRKLINENIFHKYKILFDKGLSYDEIVYTFIIDLENDMISNSEWLNLLSSLYKILENKYLAFLKDLEKIINTFLFTFLKKSKEFTDIYFDQENLKKILENVDFYYDDGLTYSSVSYFSALDNRIYLSGYFLLILDLDDYDSNSATLFHELLHSITTGSLKVDNDTGRINTHNIGLYYTTEKYVYTFLNEALTEKITELLLDNYKSDSYTKEKELYELIKTKGKKPISDRLFYNAYFEKKGIDRDKKQKNNFKILIEYITEAYDENILNKLSTIIENESLDKAIEYMRGL